MESILNEVSFVLGGAFCAFFQSCIGESLFTCGPGLRDEEASQFPRGMSVEGQEGSLYGILMACMASSFFAFLLASLLVLWTVELQMILRESILCWAGDSHFRVLIHHAHYLALWIGCTFTVLNMLLSMAETAELEGSMSQRAWGVHILIWIQKGSSLSFRVVFGGLLGKHVWSFAQQRCSIPLLHGAEGTTACRSRFLYGGWGLRALILCTCFPFGDHM